MQEQKRYIRVFAASLLIVACASVLYAQFHSPIRIHADRLSTEPLLTPQPGWSHLGLFNPAAIRVGPKTVLLFRAEDDRHVSRIGYAESLDGDHFHLRSSPVLEPVAPYEWGGGVEDPRVIQLGGIYYLTYTGYDGHSAQLCGATSRDLLHWQRQGVLLPAYKGTWNTQWTKSGAIVPRRIDGRWWMYYLGTKTDADGVVRDHMGLASSTDLLHWSDATGAPVLDRIPGAFDSRVMEPGPAPFLTDAGILLLYNGADDHLIYGPGWALFDRNDPRHLLARSQTPFLLPQLPWEKKGTVPNVVFLEGAIAERQTKSQLVLTVYYGAADKFVGRARVVIDFPPSAQ